MRLIFLTALLLAATASAQQADGPLGDILESLPADDARAPAEAEAPFIPRIAPPPPQSVPVVISRSPSGIVTTTLPPSTIGDAPFTPPMTDAMVDDSLAAGDGEAAVPAPDDAPAEPVELTAEQQQAIWEANERVRLAEIDRRMAERAEAARAAREAALADHRAALAAREAEVAARDTAYAEALDQTRRRAAAERAEWLARVEACRRGTRSACAAQGE